MSVRFSCFLMSSKIFYRSSYKIHSEKFSSRFICLLESCNRKEKIGNHGEWVAMDWCEALEGAKGQETVRECCKGCKHWWDPNEEPTRCQHTQEAEQSHCQQEKGTEGVSKAGLITMTPSCSYSCTHMRLVYPSRLSITHTPRDRFPSLGWFWGWGTVPWCPQSCFLGSP